MDKGKSHSKSYILAAFLGAIGGGAFVALTTKAIPNIMARMMRKMMAQMGRDGCNPAQI